MGIGQRHQAINHYTEMLRLNPNDNQGIRHILVNCLLEERDYQRVGQLLKRYEKDGSATWLYSRALLEFCEKGSSAKANRCLKAALEHNPFVPLYLLEQKKLPKHLPEYIGWGDEDEAIAYAAEAIHIWQKTEGVLDWLNDSMG